MPEYQVVAVDESKQQFSDRNSRRRVFEVKLQLDRQPRVLGSFRKFNSFLDPYVSCFLLSFSPIECDSSRLIADSCLV